MAPDPPESPNVTLGRTTMNTRCHCLLIGVFSLAIFPHGAGAQPWAATVKPGPLATPIDWSSVQRYDPFDQVFVNVPREEIKPNHLYRHFHTGLGRLVWSIADDDGQLQFVLGKGSVQPADRLDLRRSLEEQQRIVRERAPELAQRLATLGARPFIELDENNEWSLVGHPTLPKVYDLMTGYRWEWHGEHRTAVMHTGGFTWRIVDGKYVPLDPVQYPACCYPSYGECGFCGP